MNATYHLREMQALRAQMLRNELAPLSDRQEAQAEAAELMRDTTMTADRIQWVLSGNYGFGAMLEMRRIAVARRGNREAAAMQLLTALDCPCPQRHAIAAWKGLTPDQQSALAAAVLEVLDSYRDSVKAQS